MIRFWPFLVALGFAAALGGCTTREWVATQNYCQDVWNREIPVNPRQVSAGTLSNPQVRVVDRNAQQRDAEIANCTSTICNQRYGNPECRPG